MSATRARTYDAARHPQRNVITRALGAEPVVRVDQPETAVRAGDVVLVCSDGLTSLVPDDEISAIMGAEGDLDACAAALTAAANLAGGIDNITVVLARLGIGPQAALVPSERPKSGDTAPHPLIPAAEPVTVLGRTPPSPRRSADLPSRRTPVLEPVRRPRRRRRGRTPLVLSIVLLAGVAATASWIGSRSYFVEVDGSGMARVSHGLPFDLLGIRAYREWQGLDVPAAPIRAAEPSAVNRRIMGQGEAAALAGRLVWQYGLPVIP
ncbi:MAG: hypothetical protein HYX33_02955 [Actinobacteria bacterium]|nr:hypothetical protein [Actinomycetota bacterium]